MTSNLSMKSNVPNLPMKASTPPMKTADLSMNRVTGGVK